MANAPLLTVEATRAAMSIVQMDDGTSTSKEIQLRDFFWDRVISTMLVLIFGVTAVQAIVSYFNDERLTCVITENHTTSVQEYINQLCQKDVPNYAKFYNVAIYAEVALLSGLHVFWSQIWNGRIESFKSTVASMSLKRNNTTGQYESSDYDLARYLERNLESTALTWTYMLKIGGQITVCFLCIAFLIFHPELGFTYSVEPTLAFRCYNDSVVDGQWPLIYQTSVHCVLTELSNQQILRWFNFAALVVIIFANVVGTFLLAYSIYFYHLLDYKRVARFILYTGLRRDHYPEYHYKSGCNTEYEMCGGGCKHSCNFLVFSLFWWCKTSRCSVCLDNKYWCCCGPSSCFSDENFTRGLIPFDMTFLIVRLRGTNTKMGEAFLNVLVDNHLDYLIKNECSRLTVEDSATFENNERPDSLGQIITEVSRCFRLSKKPNYCILVTNDNDSLAYLLESYGSFEKMICINFNSVISATEESEKFRFSHANPLVYQIPSQVWTVNEKMHSEIESHVQHAVKNLYGSGNHTEVHNTVIVLAPLSDEVYISGDLRNTKRRVASLLEEIQSVGAVTNCGSRNQLYLLMIFPTAIANKTNLQSEFCGGDHEVKWLNSSSPTEFYTWKESAKVEGVTDTEVEGVTYEIHAYEANANSEAATTVV